MAEKLTPDQLTDGLAQHYGSETYTRYLLGTLLTEGAVFLAEHAGAFWLLDVICSHQLDPRVQAEEFQTWQLRPVGSGWQVTMTDGDSDAPIVQQDIPYSDFPLADGIKLYKVGRTIMLPGEY